MDAPNEPTAVRFVNFGCMGLVERLVMIVMAVLVTAIHVGQQACGTTWMRGTSPRMTAFTC